MIRRGIPDDHENLPRSRSTSHLRHFRRYSMLRWGHCARFQAGYILVPQLSAPKQLESPYFRSRSGPTPAVVHIRLRSRAGDCKRCGPHAAKPNEQWPVKLHASCHGFGQDSSERQALTVGGEPPLDDSGGEERVLPERHLERILTNSGKKSDGS